MKRKLLSLLIVMVMGMSLLVGCGGNSNENKDNDTLQSSDNVQEGTTVENTEIEEKEEIDTSIYSEKVELTTGEGKVVSIYYDPTIVTNLSGEDWTGKEEINLGEMMSIYVTDAESAKAYVDTVIDDNGGNIDIGKQEEIQLSGYTIHYFTLNEPESGVFLDKIWLIELDSDVVCRFMVIGEVTKGSQLEKELEAIKFVVGDENDTESNQNDNNEAVVEGNLQTYELSNGMGEKIGVLTYNGDTIEFEKNVFDSIADFNMCIKNENGSYTTGVTVETITCADAETYYQKTKSNTESNEKVTDAQFSEIKKTDVNGITVQYFSRIYTMNGNENKDFYCFVDFPVIDNKEYAVVLSMHYGREAEVLLSGVENLLVDIEIQGVKPGITAEDTSVKNDEIDGFDYYPEYLTTPAGKSVAVYIDTNTDISWEVDSQVSSSIYIYDKNHDVCYFSVDDAATPEEYANNILEWNDYLELGSQEEIQLAGRTIHQYHFVDKETGDVFISQGVIQLASDVVFTFAYNHMNYSESGLEEVLEALRFVVE